MYRNLSIPINLFLELPSEQRILFCKFLVYKRAFKNSIIYDYNSHRLSKLGRLPYTLNTLVNHIKLFKQRGWVEITEKGHLFLKPLEAIAALEQIKPLTKKFRVPMKDGDNHQDILHRLYACTLRDKQKQHFYAVSKTEATNNHAPKGGEIGLQISTEALAKYWGVSKTYAYDITEALIDMGLIERTVYDIKLGKMESIPKQMRLKGYFCKGGNLFKREAMVITLQFITLSDFYWSSSSSIW
jgi:hypothetical protein